MLSSRAPAVEVEVSAADVLAWELPDAPGSEATELVGSDPMHDPALAESAEPMGESLIAQAMREAGLDPDSS